MKTRARLAFAFVFLSVSLVSLLRAAEPADLIVVGDIYTVNAARSWAQALAVKDGKILFVGTEKDADKYREKSTQTLTLDPGQMVLPGLHDCHVHLLDGGLDKTNCQLVESKSPEALLQTLAAYAKEHSQQEWILGSGWPLPFYPNANPNKADLDAVIPDRPVWIFSQDGHSAWANSAALKLAGIDKFTKDPARGRIERDPATGEPTGTLREAAMDLVEKIAPKPADDVWEKALLDIQKVANSLGITSIQEAFITPRALSIYHNVAKRKALTMKVVAALGADPSKDDSQVEDLVALRDKFSVGNLRATSVKIFADGGIESLTAALLTPYVGHPDEFGILNWSPERLTSFATRLDKAGFQMHIHVIGDKATRVALDAIEAAEKTNGRGDNRHQLAHLELIAPEDLPRFRELGVIANFQPFWAYADAWIEEGTNPLLGPERASRLYQIQTMLKSGAVVAAGSDLTVSTLNPFAAIQVGFTRQPVNDKSTQPWLPDERASLPDLIAAYTINGAYTNHQEKTTGSLEAGKAADFIIIDRNLFVVSPNQIGATRVLRTFVDGEEVYRADSTTAK